MGTPGQGGEQVAAIDLDTIGGGAAYRHLVDLGGQHPGPRTAVHEDPGDGPGPGTEIDGHSGGRQPLDGAEGQGRGLPSRGT